MGVSGADELRQILGTGDIPTKKKSHDKPSTSSQVDQYDYGKDSLDEMVYRDSSTFLKVCTKVVCVSCTSKPGQLSLHTF